MPTVLLIRHGESKSNIGLPSLSSQTVTLTSMGRQQAEDIAQYLEERPPDLIVFSSYLRSRETAVPTIQKLPDVPVEDDWSVHEFTYLASWRDEYSTVEDRKPIVDLFWDLADPKIIDGPGAESFQKFIWRVWDVKERLEKLRYKGMTIAMFTHQQFILALKWVVDRNSPDVDEDDMREFRRYLLANAVENGEIRRLEVPTKVSSSTGPMPVPAGV